MSRHLGDEIAVLDGLDGHFGTGRSSPSRYVAPFSTVRRNVIDPSEGGTYGGGSSWAPGMPVMPSAVGLADADLQSIASGVLPPRMNVIDPSGGALFTGGSSWTGGMPLTPSNAGLAGDLGAVCSYLVVQSIGGEAPTTVRRAVNYATAKTIFLERVKDTQRIQATPGQHHDVYEDSFVYLARGGQVLTAWPLSVSGDRLQSWAQQRHMPLSGLSGGPIPTGRADEYSDFHGLSGGPIPTGRADSYSDFASLDAYFEAAGSSMTPTGPSTGRSSPSRYVTPFATVRRNVIDPSEGANYGGGSSYAPRMPLLPSTIGLAELSVSDMLDQVSDNAFARKLFQNQRGAFTRVAGRSKLQALKAQGVAAARQAAASGSWPERARALKRAQAASLALSRARMMRRALLGNRARMPGIGMPMRTIAAA